jgi:hypothetical protein
MKISKYLAVAAIALVSSSCTKGPGGETPYTGPRDVTIRIKQNTTQSASRALGNPIADGTPVNFKNGLLLFADANDAVTRVVEVKKGEYAFDGMSVGAVDLEGGVTIDGVPASSTKAAFIGNPSEALKPKASALGVDIKTLIVDIKSQRDSWGTVQDVTLFGEGPLTAAEGGGNKFEALVPVLPVAARFEVGKIAGKHSDPAKTLTYKVKGIFMNRIYHTMHVNGDMYFGGSGIPYINNGQTKANYVGYSTKPNTGYSPLMQGTTYDWFDGIAFDKDLNNAALSDGVSKVWAYNVLAPKETALIPSIVFVLTNVVVDGTPLTEDQFLTIGNFTRKVGDVSTPIRKIEQGKIYALPLIQFTEENLAEKPHITDKEVVIEIDLKDWERIEMGYEFI